MRENEERWRELCGLAAKEQDPQKLSELIHEINEVFADKRNREDTAGNARKASG